MKRLNIREAGPDDLTLLKEIRLDFIQELKPFSGESAREEVSAATHQWLETHITEQRLIGYIGYEGSCPACCGVLLLYDLPPLGCGEIRRVGHVLNFYTYPDFRRRGYARQLIQYIQKDARRKGLVQLVLNATPMGEPLYRASGFAEKSEPCLVFNL